MEFRSTTALSVTSLFSLVVIFITSEGRCYHILDEPRPTDVTSSLDLPLDDVEENRGRDVRETENYISSLWGEILQAYNYLQEEEQQVESTNKRRVNTHQFVHIGKKRSGPISVEENEDSLDDEVTNSLEGLLSKRGLHRFVRFGRSAAGDVSKRRYHNFVRFGRAAPENIGSHYGHFLSDDEGRDKRALHRFVRFGRSVLGYPHQSDKRGKHSFVRIGRSLHSETGDEEEKRGHHRFVRIGRSLDSDILKQVEKTRETPDSLDGESAPSGQGDSGDASESRDSLLNIAKRRFRYARIGRLPASLFYRYQASRHQPRQTSRPSHSLDFMTFPRYG